MAISKYPSVVTMPKTATPYPSILTFLCRRFTGISEQTWVERIIEGKVLDDNGETITFNTPYLPSKRLFYFREVANEPVIPFTENILFMDDEILVACKPHFLPVTPGGRYVEECLLNRLRKATGINDIVPLHRIDRETAGIVLFSINKKTRGVYGSLFMNGSVEKTYQAVSGCDSNQKPALWEIENRIVHGNPWFTMTTAEGKSNAKSTIKLVEVIECKARFILHPHTGKTHQLRLHLSGLGFGILNDRYYPQLQDEREDNFDMPLQLLAKKICFRDPLNGKEREFESSRQLLT